MVDIVVTHSGEAVPYEILQKIPVVESKPATPLSTHDNSIAPSELNASQETVKADVGKDNALKNTLLATSSTPVCKSTQSLTSPDKSPTLGAVRGNSPLAIQSMYAANKPPSDSPTEMETFMDSLVPPCSHYTKDGMVTFTDFYFPPPLLPSVLNKESFFASSESLNSTASEDEAKRKVTEKMARKSPHISPLHSTSQRLPAKKKQTRSPVKSSKGRRLSETLPKSPTKVKRKESTVTVAKSRSQMSPDNKALSRKEKLLRPKRQAHCWLGMYPSHS